MLYQGADVARSSHTFHGIIVNLCTTVQISGHHKMVSRSKILHRFCFWTITRIVGRKAPRLRLKITVGINAVSIITNSTTYVIITAVICAVGIGKRIDVKIVIVDDISYQ